MELCHSQGTCGRTGTTSPIRPEAQLGGISRLVQRLTVGWARGCCAGHSERHSESLTDMGIELESLHAANREQQVGLVATRATAVGVSEQR